MLGTLLERFHTLLSLTVLSYFFFFPVPTACPSSWGQGSNLGCNSDPSRSSNNVGSFTHWATRELPFFFSFFFLMAAPAAFGSSQRLSRSCNWGLHHIHGNTGSLTYWAWPGIKHISLQTLCRVLNPLSHNGNSPIFIHVFKGATRN